LEAERTEAVANSPTNARTPWGELVAHEQRMATADLFALPEDGYQPGFSYPLASLFGYLDE
jgi:hypothetical protein